MHQWGKYASLDSFLQRWWGGNGSQPWANSIFHTGFIAAVARLLLLRLRCSSLILEADVAPRDIEVSENDAERGKLHRPTKTCSRMPILRRQWVLSNDPSTNEGLVEFRRREGKKNVVEEDLKNRSRPRKTAFTPDHPTDVSAEAGCVGSSQLPAPLWHRGHFFPPLGSVLGMSYEFGETLY